MQECGKNVSRETIEQTVNRLTVLLCSLSYAWKQRTENREHGTEERRKTKDERRTHSREGQPEDSEAVKEKKEPKTKENQIVSRETFSLPLFPCLLL